MTSGRLGKQPTYTFGNGDTVEIRPLTQMLALTVYDQIEPPAPPTHRVNYGTADNPEYREEPNPADPNYEAEMARYQGKIGLLLTDLAIQHCIIDKSITASQLNEVKELRDTMESIGVTLPTSDKIVYYRYIAMSDSDLENFVSACQNAYIDREKVNETKESFPSNV
jgi:hypothetical protein